MVDGNLTIEQQQALALARARRRRAQQHAVAAPLSASHESNGEHSASRGPLTEYQRLALDELIRRRGSATPDQEQAELADLGLQTGEARRELARRELERRHASRASGQKQFDITAPDGKKYRVTGENMEGALAALKKHQATGSSHPEFDPANVPGREPGDTSRTTAALSSFVDGIPIAGPYLQAGVEHVASGIGSLISDRPRSEVHSEMSQMVDDSQAEFPWTSTAAGIGGAVAGTLPAVLAVPAAFGAGGGGLLGRTFMSGLSGATIGGADSAVRSGGDLRESGIGALKGGGVGLAGPVVGKAVGAGWQRLRDYRAAKQAASAAGVDKEVLSRLGKAARNDGLDPAALGQRMRDLGPDGMLMDAGPNLQQQAGALAATPGRGQEIVRSAIDARQAGAGGRLGSALDDALGQSADTLAIADDIVTQRAAAARPLYQRAYQDGSEGVWSPELERMAGSPMFSDAMRNAATRGQDRAVLDGFGSFNPRVTVTQDGRIAFNQARAGGSPLYPDLQYWDYVKRELDDIAGAATRAGRREEAGVATNLASRLRNELDNAVPSYRAAREAYSGPSAILDAMEDGQRVFRNSTTPGQLRKQMSAMNEAEHDAFIQGARAQVAEAMGTARNDALAARSMFQKGFNRDKLEILLGKDEAGKLLKHLEAETIFAGTRDVVTRNSLTASRQEAMRDIAGQTGQQFGVREGYMAGGIMGAARSAGIDTVERIARLLASSSREARNSGLAKALSSRDHDAIVKALAKSMGPKVDRQLVDGMARALLVGGGTGAARP